jgi:hypothetical protein
MMAPIADCAIAPAIPVIGRKLGNSHPANESSDVRDEPETCTSHHLTGQSAWMSIVMDVTSPLGRRFSPFALTPDGPQICTLRAMPNDRIPGIHVPTLGNSRVTFIPWTS